MNTQPTPANQPLLPRVYDVNGARHPTDFDSLQTTELRTGRSFEGFVHLRVPPERRAGCSKRLPHGAPASTNGQAPGVNCRS